MYNLLTNAIKYRSPDRKPHVVIGMRKHKEETVITVRDNGLGIAAESQSKLFGMFKRMHDHVEGTGIGLYIVKRTIEKYGGRIEVMSEKDKGTEFRIFIKNAEMVPAI